MGRCKLQIKRIENTTNRQVTYSKRRNGILKKAHELSVLCDVDIALIMFSPSGRLSLFSGHKRIEDVLARFVNLPEHERGRLQNHESIQRTIERMKIENDLAYQVAVCMTPGRVQSQLEELQQEINNLQAQLFEAERKLRNYEGEALFLNNMHEVEYYERFLEESLNRVRAYRMQQSEDANDIFDNGTNQCMDCIPHLQSAEPQSQVLNFLDTNGILPLRGQTQQFTECFPANTTNYVSLMNNNGLDASADHGKNDIVLSIQYDSTGVNLSQWNGGTGRQVI